MGVVGGRVYTGRVWSVTNCCRLCYQQAPCFVIILSAICSANLTGITHCHDFWPLFVDGEKGITNAMQFRVVAGVVRE